MPTHILAPSLCDDCLIPFLAGVEAHPTLERSGTFCWCPHRETIATCAARDGAIVSWMMERPVSPDEAGARMDELYASVQPPH